MVSSSTNPPFSPRQIEFIKNSKAKYNLAHGAVRSGKTVATLFKFMTEALHCPGNSIFIIGYSLSTIYRNIISLLFDSPELNYFASLCSWSKGNHVLLYGNKTIRCIGAGDEGALGVIQGVTIDLCYCDEMTLYPPNVIDMIDTRLSREHSKLYASMNPKQPEHKIKKWIDKAEDNELYYALHFSIDDNIFLPDSYKKNIKENLSGLFYKRNYLGLWCMAEGAVYDFFDRNIHVTEENLPSADYYIAGIDYGTSQTFACVLIAISTGKRTYTGRKIRVEKEYYWDVSQTNRQKTNTEYLRDLSSFLDGYPIKGIYIDPSASSFKLEMRKASYPVIDADNDVLNGIQMVSSFMYDGTLAIHSSCRNLIKEIEGYIWDPKKAAHGKDAPVKKEDHACVVGNTLIQLSTDQRVPIEEMEGSTLLNYNVPENTIEFDSVVQTQLTRENAPIYQLELDDGTILQATPDHQVLTDRGFVELQDLMLSDTVLTCSTKSISEESSI